MKQLKKNEKILLATVGIVILVFMLSRFFKPQGQINPIPGPDFAGPKYSGAAEITETLATPQYNFLFDPFEKSNKIEVTEDIGRQTLKLEGIFWSQDNPLAVISGKEFKVGGLVEGFRIMAINKESVELEKDGETHILKLEGSNILQQER